MIEATERIYSITKWLGLNENPDGDTKLKNGEASKMVNFKVTRDGNLQRRPGYAKKLTFTDEDPVQGLWVGNVGGYEYLIAVCGGTVYKVSSSFVATSIGTMAATGPVTMFGYENKLYLLDGTNYKCWDGSTFAAVEGYIPTIIIGADPASGAGTTFEQINKLTAKRYVSYSADGTSDYLLPETADSLDSVTVNGTETTAYTFASNTVSFTSPPSAGTNNVVIGYSVSSSFASDVTSMRYYELFNGAQETRVFLYGDGTNKAIYSGLDKGGEPRADYFPDLNILDIGEENTPITGLVRNYARLMAFKTDSAYIVQYGVITLEDGTSTAAFYTTPMNKIVGNIAMGQVMTVLNTPLTIFGKDVYEWVMPRTATIDERHAKCISDRVHRSLGQLTGYTCYDDNQNQEYYIFDGTRAVVLNYAADAWYDYTLPALCMVDWGGTLYFGDSEGNLMELSEDHLDDDGTPIDAYWESGSISFGKDFERKSSSVLWVGTKPHPHTYLEVTLSTDRKSEHAEKTIQTSLATFENVDFADWSFDTNYRPQMTRLKIKAKKFVYYKLIMKSEQANSTAVVTAADVRVRYIGYAK